jgi:hypothetical protein
MGNRGDEPGKRGEKMNLDSREGQDGRRKVIRSYRELDVYRLAMQGAMRVFELTKGVPGLCHS